jgi:RNA polymerase sigma factor (sigma-70 family)
MLDHHKLLAGDPGATSLFLMVARQWARKFFRKRSQLAGVTQSAIAEMLAKLAAGNIPEPDRTVYWALTCTNNAVRRELTRIRNHRAVSFESALHCQDATGPSAQVRAREELAHVDALLAACDASAREFVEARACGYTYQEIAQKHELRPEAVRAAVSRLRRKLIAQLISQQNREGLHQHVIRAMMNRRGQLTPRPDSSSSVSSAAGSR